MCHDMLLQPPSGWLIAWVYACQRLQLSDLSKAGVLLGNWSWDGVSTGVYGMTCAHVRAANGYLRWSPAAQHASATVDEYVLAPARQHSSHAGCLITP